MNNTLERKYGLFTAICMVVGIVIGSGVFFKAQTVLQKTGGDMPLGIIAWIIGGAIMLVCLLAFSFMGQKYEKVNGIVDYSEATVGPNYGYMMGWFTSTIYYPAMTSALAWLTARYLLVFLTASGMPLTDGSNPVTGPECMVLALFFMAFSYAVNTLSPKLAGKFQTSTTVIKLIPLGLMAVVGIIYGIASGTLTQNFVTKVAVDGVSSSPLFAAVCATSFAYEGWIIATAINSELKDSKKNLPKALTLGGIIIVAVYILYYLGVAGGASNADLIGTGAQVAFINIFGNVLGNILNLFIAISCFGTLNGLMLGCCRGMYSVAARGRGPAPKILGKVDEATGMPSSSCVFALLVTAAWLVYFYFANLWSFSAGGETVSLAGKPFAFDSTELPIITIYLMYLPIFFQWIRKEKDQSPMRRFVMPILAMCGSAFMVVACIFSHRMACLWYVILFAVIMLIGWLLDKPNRKAL
ncbi:MAG: APC family permease [Oscillospiraceae bacterium]|nr:APC family permease [Oscillospiraceae bacterium]